MDTQADPTEKMGSEIPIPDGLIEEPLDHAMDIIGETFKDDPFQRYVLSDDLAKRGETEVSYEYNREIFAEVIAGMVAGGARSLTVAGSGISSVWRLEPITDEPIISPHYPPAITELNLAAHKTKKQHLPPDATHMLHLSLLGNYREHPSNDKSRNHKASDVMRPVLKMAKEKGWPVVLEATTEKGRDMYKHLGMEVLEEYTFGQGKVGSDGKRKEGGEGVKIWVMMA